MTGFSRVAKILDRVAEKFGVPHAAVLTRPHLLAGTGLAIDDIDETSVHEAERLHRSEMRMLQARVEAYNSR